MAQTQQTRGQLQALEERSTAIIGAYGARADADSGSELKRLLGFVHGLSRIQTETAGERRKANHASEEATAQLRMAERRHDLTDAQLRAAKNLNRRQADQRDGAHLTPGNPVLARKLKG